MKNLKVLLIASLVTWATSATGQDQPNREITNISGDLYRFQNNTHFTVFLVTEEGIIVTDPVDREAATWLSDELKSRFDKPIKYLIYSHDHADHISGGEVFAEAGATVVGHELTRSQIIANNRPTAIPDLTFSDKMTIELGGKTVQLIYAGLSHSDNSIIMHFTDEKTVYVVDFITVKRLPYRDLGNSYFPEWMEAIKKVESIDFEILAPGHGVLGTKADAAEHRNYLEDLYRQVVEERKAGKSVDEMKGSINLKKYSHFGQYEAWLPLNIEGVNRSIEERE